MRKFSLFCLRNKSQQRIFNFTVLWELQKHVHEYIQKYMQCSADKIVIHFKLAAYKNCNVCKFMARNFRCLLCNDEQLSFSNSDDDSSSFGISLSRQRKPKSITNSFDFIKEASNADNYSKVKIFSLRFLNSLRLLSQDLRVCQTRFIILWKTY